MMNNIPIKTPGGARIEINENEYDITHGIQNALTNKTYKSAKSMNDNEKLVFSDFLNKTGYYSRKLTKGKRSGLDKYIKNDVDNDVARILNIGKKNLRAKELKKLPYHLT